MISFSILCFIIAAVIFFIAAFSGWKAYPWHGGLIAAGLFFLTVGTIASQAKVTQ